VTTPGVPLHVRLPKTDVRRANPGARFSTRQNETQRADFNAYFEVATGSHVSGNQNQIGDPFGRVSHVRCALIACKHCRPRCRYVADGVGPSTIDLMHDAEYG
jgi:hypothetical protein